MLTQRLANIVFAVVLIGACVWFAIIAQGFQATGLLASSGLPSKFFPHLTLAIIAFCALVVALLYALRGHAGDDADQTVFSSGTEARRGLSMLVVAVLCYLIWLKFGFIPMAVLIGPLSLLAMGVRSLWITLTVLVLTALIYAVFTYFLGVQLR